MKGSSYDIIIFIAVSIFGGFLWILLDYCMGLLATTIISIATVPAVITNITVIKDTMHYSFFFIIILGFVWIYKKSQDKKNNYYVQ